jgi:uncharacterized protein (TIGR02466 family)
MKLEPMFVVDIGTDKDVESLDTARKIFKENKNLFSSTTERQNFSTTLNTYYSEKANIPNYKNSADIKKLKKSIKQKSNSYLELCGYDTDKFCLKVINIWLNEMHSASKHDPHSHYGPNISGCYYVDIPKNCGPIIFTTPLQINTCAAAAIKDYTFFNSCAWRFFPEEGDMYFWKSNLIHEVPFSKFEGIRRSIAFDVVITPKKP